MPGGVFLPAVAPFLLAASKIMKFRALQIECTGSTLLSMYRYIYRVFYTCLRRQAARCINWTALDFPEDESYGCRRDKGQSTIVISGRRQSIGPPAGLLFLFSLFSRLFRAAPSRGSFLCRSLDLCLLSRVIFFFLFFECEVRGLIFNYGDGGMVVASLFC